STLAGTPGPMPLPGLRQPTTDSSREPQMCAYALQVGRSTGRASGIIYLCVLISYTRSSRPVDLSSPRSLLQLHRLPALGDRDAVVALGAEGRLQVLLPLQVAVDEEEAPEPIAVQHPDKVEEAGLVGVGGEVVQDRDLGLAPVRLAEDADLGAPLHDPLAD